MSAKTALVLRATGSQGKATVAHLLNSGWTCHALVTDPGHARALALRDLGAVLYKGALSDTSSVQSAIAGCTAVFLNQMPSFEGDSEAQEAASLINLAKKAGVNHIVHSTSLPLNDPDVRTKLAGNLAAAGVLGKGDVEKLVQESGIPWTILRPGYFMTNLILPLVNYMQPALAKGKFISSYKPETVLPLIDTDDIGTFVAAALENPGRFAGKIVSLAGEKLSVQHIVQELSRASGKDVEAIYHTSEETQKEIEANNIFVAGQVLSRDLDQWVDIEEVKTWGIPLTSFQTFLQKNKESVVP